MNIKKPSMATPLNYGAGGTGQVQAQNQFKSLPPKNADAPGNNGVVVHAVGCSGNHLGKC